MNDHHKPEIVSAADLAIPPDWRRGRAGGKPADFIQHKSDRLRVSKAKVIDRIVYSAWISEAGGWKYIDVDADRRDLQAVIKQAEKLL